MSDAVAPEQAPAQRVRIHQETGHEARTYTLEFTDGERSWREPLWSVTTLLRALDKPALPRWAAGAVASYVVEQMKYLPQDLERFGPDELRRTLADAPYRTKSRAADIGTAVHTLIDHHIRAVMAGACAYGKDEAQAPPVDPSIVHEVMPRFAQFLLWEAEWRPRYFGAEMTVYNTTDMWAGTLDTIIEVGDGSHGPGLIDVKNTNAKKGGAPGVYFEHPLQVAAYKHATEIVPVRGVWTEPVPMPDVKWGAVLWLAPNDHALVQVSVSDETYRAFLIAAEMFRHQDGPAKREILGVRESSYFGIVPPPIVWEAGPPAPGADDPVERVAQEDAAAEVVAPKKRRPADGVLVCTCEDNDTPTHFGDCPFAGFENEAYVAPAPLAAVPTIPDDPLPDLGEPEGPYVTETERKRVLAVGNEHGMKHPAVKALVRRVTGATSTTRIPKADLEKVLTEIRSAGDPGPER